MSKNNFSVETPEERALWASRVKRLRGKTSLTQTELAHEAGTSRQTINNIERGVLVPQTGTLKKVLVALGLTLTPMQFAAQTETWMKMLGQLIEMVPEPRREKSVLSAMDVIVAEMAEPQEYNNDPIPFPNVGGDLEDEAISLGAVADNSEGGPEDDQDQDH